MRSTRPSRPGAEPTPRGSGADAARRSRPRRAAAALAATAVAFAGLAVSAEQASAAAAANGACTRAQRNQRVMQADGSYLVCTQVGKAYRWRVSPPRHGDPCTQKARNYPGTALDCVPGPGTALRWRNRGSVWNPYRLNEPVEIYSFEGSKFRVVLTHWNPDVQPADAELDISDPSVNFVVWRYQATLLSSSKPGNADRPSEGSVPFAYVRTDSTRDDQTIGLTDERKPGDQEDLRACRDSRILLGSKFPDPAGLKPRLEKLAVGESGYDDWCVEAPAGQQANLIFESASWFTRPELKAEYSISVYFTGNPR